MKCVVELSEVEETTLQQLSINHKHRDTRTRAAGLLMLGRRSPEMYELEAQWGSEDPVDDRSQP
jgi:hypothetical protein